MLSVPVSRAWASSTEDVLGLCNSTRTFRRTIGHVVMMTSPTFAAFPIVAKRRSRSKNSVGAVNLEAVGLYTVGFACESLDEFVLCFKTAWLPEACGWHSTKQPNRQDDPVRLYVRVFHVCASGCARLVDTTSAFCDQSWSTCCRMLTPRTKRGRPARARL
jgi:hypothetical protein